VELETAESAYVEQDAYVPVLGGCGNCRFFTTGPAFLVQQAQVCNELMLDLREMGRRRRAMYDRLVEWELKSTDPMSNAERQRWAIEKQTLSQSIQDVEREMEPLVLEWFNRYQLFEESKTLLAEWRALVGNQKTERNAHGASLMLVASAEPKDVVREIDVRIERAGDFALVRSIMEGAKLRGGIAKASRAARHRIAEFMDRILRQDNARVLLLDIPEENTRHEVAFLLAQFAQQMVGDAGVQQALDANSGLGLQLGDAGRVEWLEWAGKVIGAAQSQVSGRLVDLLLPRFTDSPVAAAIE